MSEGSDAVDTTLLGIGTWTKQGPATLVLRESAWVVLVPGLRRQVIEAAWTVLGEQPAPEDFLDRLVEAAELESADKLTALLFGFHDGNRAVFGVKGTTPIAVYTAEGSQQIAGTEEEPFVLRSLDGVRRTAFGDLPLEDGIGAPRVEGGIVPVRGFVHVTTDPAQLEEDERAALAAQVEEDGRSIEDPETKKRRAERPAPRSISSVSTPPSSSRPAASASPTGAMSSTPPRSGAGSSTAPRAADPEPAAPNMFDGLFGAAETPDRTAPAPSPPPQPDAASSPTASSAPAPEAPDARAEAADPAPAAVSRREATAAPTGRKRRLVSSSLFDRRPRSSQESRPAAADPERPSPEPAPASTPGTDGTAAAQSPAEPSAQPAAAHPRSAPASVPTPDPPEHEDPPATPEEDELHSPVTQIAPIDDEDGEHSEPAPAPRRAPAHRPAAPAAAGSELENTGAYDDLFGKTVFRRIEDAAVRRSEEEHDEESADSGRSGGAAGESPSPAPTPAEPDPGPDADPAPSRTAAESEFIDWVPGVGRAAPEIARTAARRAAAPPPAEPAYPQVHMAQRPPHPNTGSRPAPTRPSMPPPAPYERPGNAAFAGPPMNTGAAGQQLGYPSRSGPPSPHPGAAVNPGAAGHQLGFPSPQTPHAHGGGKAQAQGWTGSPNPPRPPHHGPAMPQNPPSPQNLPPQAMPPQGMSRPGAPPQPSTPPPGTPPQHMPRAQGMPAPQSTSPHGAAAQTGRPSTPPPAGPGRTPGNAVTLTGLVCANGHANSPERSVCRSCGAPLHGPPRTVTRPPLGVVQVSGGDPFVLDRTAIIGRRPRASRVSGNDVPQLITVPSPQQDISRSHLELRLEGWHVVAIDLGTTNGTTLHREGFEPVRLRPREGVVLHDGDLLDLGDDVHLTFGERA